jgi:adenylate kinase family enzyme
MKIAVIGHSSSGKSTFSKRLAHVYHIPVLHIDKIFFEPNWVERDKTLVASEIKAFMNQKDWIIDGFYRRLATERFDEADQIFIFNFNRFKCLYGAIVRRFKYHNQNRDSVCVGCKERLNLSFVWWILFGGRKKDSRQLLNKFEMAYKEKVVVFRTRKQANHYLRSIGYDGTLNYE